MTRSEFLSVAERYNRSGWYVDIVKSKESMCDHCSSTKIDGQDSFLYWDGGSSHETELPDYYEKTHDECMPFYRKLFKNSKYVYLDDGYGWTIYLGRGISEREIQEVFDDTLGFYLDSLEEME